MPDKKELAYIPGLRPQENKPLDRYLPPIHQGVASTWLADRAPKSGWLLDPFGASPDLAIEAAQKGYRVLVTANNPVTRFVMEILANPPTTAEFQAALAMLASLQIGRERLEPHIKSLYETTCSECHQSIQADSFLWRRDEVVPYARIYDCPYCGDAGNRPANTADIHKAGGFQKSGLHLARALERVAPLRDPDRRHVAEALEVYLPRAIYALLTIINKLSGIPRGDQNLRPLNALLLLAFDRANTLWLYPKERQRPRQLTVPSQFREHNIWSALESAIHLWRPPNNPVPVSFWPELPPDKGGICLFEGRVKELAAKLPKIDIHAVLTAFPRPNQAFWTLSALWSGWLWGHEAVEHFKSVLRRRRYDWSWHASAIQSAISSLNEDLPKGIPFLGLVPEVEPGFLSAVLLGCQLSKLDLDGIALRVDDSQAQITWVHRPENAKPTTKTIDIKKVIASSAKIYLEEIRGEPSPYLYLHAAALVDLAANHEIRDTLFASDYLSQIQSAFPQALSYRNGFLRFKGSEKSLEVGQWWIKDPDSKTAPLADRVEIALVDFLIKNPGSSLPDLDSAICQNLPGLAPPSLELLQECLASYGHQKDPQDDAWFILEGDRPVKRRSDIQEMATILTEMGERLGFRIQYDPQTNHSVQWLKSDSQTQYQFFISASAVLGKYLSLSQLNRGQCLIVLPGSRSNLVVYKLKQNVPFQQIADRGWKFIKYRHLRQLRDSSTLDNENLDEQLSLDPLTYSKPQIRLL